MKIYLNDFSKVKAFNRLAQDKDYDVILMTFDGKYRVDGKSILGIYSLDLSQPLILDIPEEYQEEFEKFA